MHMWKGHDDFRGIIQSPLMAFTRDFDFSQAKERGFDYDFKVDELTLMGYVAQVLAWVRCARLKEPNGGFDGVDYHAKKVLQFDALEEDWAAEKLLGFKGKHVFEVFTTRLDADPASEEYKKAYAGAWRLLTNSSMQKITHGKNITHDIHCGTLLDEGDNVKSDCAEGTFGELLRHGSVQFEQTRGKITYLEPELPAPKDIIHKGLLEA